jgi:hypothetical protein
VKFNVLDVPALIWALSACGTFERRQKTELRGAVHPLSLLCYLTAT